MAHVEGGIGNIAETLASAVKANGGRVVYRHEGTSIRRGRPYQVFTAFKRAWLQKPKPAVPDMSIVPQNLSVTIDLPSREIDFGDDSIELPVAGEEAALEQLDRFLDSAIFGYAEDRNQLDRNGTSFLSPYLRFGMLSIRQAYWGAKAAIDLAGEAADRVSAEAWLSELVWREYRTEFHIGLTYGLSESAVCRTIQKVEKALIKSKLFHLPGKKKLTSSDTIIKVVLVDVTEQPIERPQKTTATL